MNLNAISRLKEQYGSALRTEPSPLAFARWDSSIRAESSADEDNTINILEVIGYDPWTGGGVSAQRISAALARIGDGKEVTVQINSPGGDVFEGFAIYTLLDDYKGKVNVKVLGLAASAASIIAMAGEDIEMSRAGFYMIHNCWGLCIGDRHDFRKSADVGETIDRTIASIYSHRSGIDAEDATQLMDDETWLNADQAVEKGFATGIMDKAIEKDEKQGKNSMQAIRRADLALAQAGMSRSERRALILELKQGTQDAAESGMQDAAANLKPLSFTPSFDLGERNE